MIVTTLLATFAPVAVEGIKQLIVRLTGGVKATTVEDQIKLDMSDIERLKALAVLDNPGGTPSQWVVDLRASSRYVGALVTILAGISSIFIPDVPVEAKAVALEAASVCFGFLFGQRIVTNFKK
jgi:hypothetical protein